VFCALSLSSMPSGAPHNKLYPQHVLYNFIDFRLNSAWLIQACNILVILAGAAMTSLLSISQEITGKNNYLPAFLYLLFAFTTTTNAFIHPALLANLCVLVSLYYFIGTYRVDHALPDLFKASFFMGLAPFFYTNYLLLLPLCFMTLIILRPFQWRDWAITLLGFLLPLYLFMSMSYLVNEDMWRMLSAFRDTMGSFQKPLVSEYYYPFLFMLLILLVLTIASYVARGFGAKIKTQKAKYVLLWLTLLVSINVFLNNDSDFLFVSCIIPFSILIGDYLAELHQLKIANTLLFLLIGGFMVVYLHKLSVF
jgi:hypothetical protein